MGTLLRHELEAAMASEPVVLLPIGSAEQHGPACPLDVDIAGAHAVCLRAAQAIEDFACLVLPPLPYGLARATWAGSAP